MLVLVFSSSCTAQQNTVSRISAAKRADDKGYVIRLHMNAEADSFAIAQPRTNVIQLEVFAAGIDTVDIKQNLIPEIDHVSLYPLTHGMGVVFYLKEDAFFRAEAYPDGAGNDLLLALTETTEKELQAAIDPERALAWAPKLESEPIVQVEPVPVQRTRYNKLKEKLKIDVIVIDAGHGGHDVGAIGYSGHYEKDIVFAISKKVGEYIKKNMPGVKVVYTRTGDYFVGDKTHPGISHLQSLIERGQIANRANGDLFISIHANSAAANQAHGTEVYFLGLERSQTALDVMKRENNIVDLEEGEKRSKITEQEMFIYKLANSANIAASQKLAGMIYHQFDTRANRRTRGVKQARFVVLYHASMPAVLVETGFITNPKEEEYLTSDYGQSIIASAIYRAIRDYKQQFEKSMGFTQE